MDTTVRGSDTLSFAATPDVFDSEWKSEGWVGVPSDEPGRLVVSAREAILTDHVFDDTGPDLFETANADLPEADKPFGGRTATDGTYGDYAYPSDSAYRGNAADIVEVRFALDANYTYALIVLNALVDPHTSAFEMWIGNSVLSIAGLEANIDGSPVDVHADAVGNLFEVRIPRQVFDPGGSVQKVFLGAGLWNPALGTWLQPHAISRPRPFFDLAFAPDLGLSYWNDRRQAHDINQGAFVDDRFDVDFGALVEDRCESALCTDTTSLGAISLRWFKSSQGLGEGISTADADGVRSLGETDRLYRSPYQPFVFYAPVADPDIPHPLVLLLHPDGGNHMSFALTAWPDIQAWADEMEAYVAMPFERSPSEAYEEESERDVFEVMDIVAHQVPLDVDRVYLMGVGAGGTRAFRLAHRHPDVFAGAMAWGAATTPGGACDQRSYQELLELSGNASNMPLVSVHGVAEPCGPADDDEWRASLARQGGRLASVTYLARRGETSFPGDDPSLILRWFGDTPRRTHVPTCVTYRFAGISPSSARAYWLDDITPDPSASERWVVADASTGLNSSQDSAPEAAIGPAGPYATRELVAQSAVVDPNHLRLNVKGILRLTALLDRLDWRFGSLGAIEGSADSPFDLELADEIPNDVVIHGGTTSRTSRGLVVHVPEGEFHIEISS